MNHTIVLCNCKLPNINMNQPQAYTCEPPHSTPLGCYSGEGNGDPLQDSCLENPMDGAAWWAAVHGVEKSRTRLSNFTFTSHFHALEKEMATHSSVLAWRIPGSGEPGGLPSMGSHRVGHDWSDSAAAAGCYRALDEFPASYSKLPLAVYLTYGNSCLHVTLHTPCSPLLPHQPCQACSLCLRLHCCPAHNFISTIFLDSIHMRQYTKFVSLISCTLCNKL